MNKIAFVLGIVIVLSFLSVSSASDINDDSLNVFSAVILEQTPPIVPAIALEQRADARVKVFISLSAITLGNVEYKIEEDRLSVGLYKADKSGLIGGVSSAWFIDADDVSYDNILNPSDETMVVADIRLNGRNTGREIRIVEDETAEKICSGELNDSKIIGESIPDELNLTLRIPVVFRACKDGDGTFKETGKCTGTLLNIKNYKDPGDTSVNYELQKCLNKVDDDVASGRLDPSKATEKKNKCNEDLGGGGLFGNTIIDYVYVDVVIGIDKTNLDKLIGPEELKKQICRTQDWKEELDRWINKVDKAKNFFQSTCLVSVLGGAFNILRGDVCDARDSISLGCDWLFCPSDECHGFDPMNSIVTASTMCWDFNKHFFGKDLSFIQNDDSITYERPEKREDYKSAACDYRNDDTSGSIIFPHYACITGVEGNLEVINKMINGYQECLIQARIGGVSIGWCDKLRSYFLCDRILGEALSFTGEGGVQSLIGKFFSSVIGKPLDLIIPGDSKDFYTDTRKAASDLKDLSIARYKNVPFIQLVGKEKQFIKNQVCYSFISGDLFSLESMKQSLNLLDVDYPDSAFVITEKRPWSSYKDGDDNLAVSEYSYDVFFQLYNGEKSPYAGSGYYNVYLQVLSGKDCNSLKTIPIASGTVKEGQMVQDNVFKVVNTGGCQDPNVESLLEKVGIRKSTGGIDRDQQCLKFKGRSVCAPIGQVLSFATKEPYDPFGFSILDKNDKDKDGFSDNWEMKYFGLNAPNDISIPGRNDDRDGDGYCNAEEYLAGTDPTNKLLHPTSLPDCGPASTEVEKRGNTGTASIDSIIINEQETSQEDIEIPGSAGGYDTIVAPIKVPEDSSGVYTEEPDSLSQRELIVDCDKVLETGKVDSVYVAESDSTVSVDSLGVSATAIEKWTKDKVIPTCEREHKTELNDCDTKCENDNGCECKVYGCNVGHDDSVAKGSSCGGKRDKVYGSTTSQYKISSKYNEDYQEKVVQLADKYGVPRLLALATVVKESEFRHCCKEASNVGDNCNPDYDTETCSENPDLMITSGSSFGITQINYGKHKDCFDESLNSERSSGSICNIEECNGETVRNIDCNIAAGMNYLKRLYSWYSDGCKMSQTYKDIASGKLKKENYPTFLDGCNICKNLDGFKFYNYGGWDATLRAYNGWSCIDPKQQNYVEQIRSLVDIFKV